VCQPVAALRIQELGGFGARHHAAICAGTVHTGAGALQIGAFPPRPYDYAHRQRAPRPTIRPPNPCLPPVALAWRTCGLLADAVSTVGFVAFSPETRCRLRFDAQHRS
jgi:hypothetical protein